LADDLKGGDMPPRGVRKGSKRARQYEHVKAGQRKRGVAPRRAREIAARTVNKARARTGRAKGPTREQLYNEAKKLRVAGRSRMNKAQLQRAVAAKKR
jgi:hypothetical protein